MKKIDREELAGPPKQVVGKSIKPLPGFPVWLVAKRYNPGGGSLAGALFLGVIGGYSILWVQLLAMILGVIMLCAIGYITLSTGRSPFRGDAQRD